MNPAQRLKIRELVSQINCYRQDVCDDTECEASEYILDNILYRGVADNYLEKIGFKLIGTMMEEAEERLQKRMGYDTQRKEKLEKELRKALEKERKAIEERQEVGSTRIFIHAWDGHKKFWGCMDITPWKKDMKTIKYIWGAIGRRPWKTRYKAKELTYREACRETGVKIREKVRKGYVEIDADDWKAWRDGELCGEDIIAIAEYNKSYPHDG